MKDVKQTLNEMMRGGNSLEKEDRKRDYSKPGADKEPNTIPSDESPGPGPEPFRTQAVF